MTFSELENYLKKGISARFSRFGYKHKTKAPGFVRKTSEGSNFVVVAKVNYRTYFKISFSFSIRIDEVQKILLETGRIMPEYFNGTSTLLIPWTFFSGIKDYIVNDYVHIDQILDELEQNYQAEIDSFLLKFSNTKTLNETINIQKQDIGFLTVPEDYCKRIILAYLAKDQGFDSIVAYYLNRYKNDFPDDLDYGPPIIQSVVKFLENNRNDFYYQ